MRNHLILFVFLTFSTKILAIPSKQATEDDPRDFNDKVAALVIVVICGGIGGMLLQAI